MGPDLLDWLYCFWSIWKSWQFQDLLVIDVKPTVWTAGLAQTPLYLEPSWGIFSYHGTWDCTSPITVAEVLLHYKLLEISKSNHHLLVLKNQPSVYREHGETDEASHNTR